MTIFPHLLVALSCIQVSVMVCAPLNGKIYDIIHEPQSFTRILNLTWILVPNPIFIVLLSCSWNCVLENWLQKSRLSYALSVATEGYFARNAIRSIFVRFGNLIKNWQTSSEKKSIFFPCNSQFPAIFSRNLRNQLDRTTNSINGNRLCIVIVLLDAKLNPTKRTYFSLNSNGSSIGLNAGVYPTIARWG